MEMKKYLNILALLAMLVAAPACSLTGDEPDDSSKELSVEVDNILITADGNSFAKFTVLYGDKDVSSEAKYYNADTNMPVEMPGARFCTETPGSYKFWVSYKTLTSEVITITAISGKVLSRQRAKTRTGTCIAPSIPSTQATLHTSKQVLQVPWP